MSRDDLPTDLNHADIALLKALVSEGPRSQSTGGLLFLVGGLVYAAQCFGQAMTVGRAVPDWVHLTLGVLPTFIFLAVLFRVLSTRRKEAQGKGVAQRALNAGFTSAGITNMVMIFIFVWLAYSRQEITFWLLYPTMVCAVQGAAWYVAYMIRKRLWLALVSAGWFISAIALALCIDNLTVFILIMGAALLLCMALPGYLMMRQAKEA